MFHTRTLEGKFLRVTKPLGLPRSSRHDGAVPRDVAPCHDGAVVYIEETCCCKFRPPSLFVGCRNSPFVAEPQESSRTRQARRGTTQTDAPKRRTDARATRAELRVRSLRCVLDWVRAHGGTVGKVFSLHHRIKPLW